MGVNLKLFINIGEKNIETNVNYLNTTKNRVICAYEVLTLSNSSQT